MSSYTDRTRNDEAVEFMLLALHTPRLQEAAMSQEMYIMTIRCVLDNTNATHANDVLRNGMLQVKTNREIQMTNPKKSGLVIRYSV
jgi:hypothetical protein